MRCVNLSTSFYFLIRCLSLKYENSALKVADYPFTTLVPNLGVCEMDYRTTVFADIPGETLPSQGEASYCVRQIAIGVQAMSPGQQVTAE